MSAYGTSYGESQGNTYEEARVKGRGEGESGPCGKLCGSLCCSMMGIVMYISSLVLVANNEMSTVCVQRALQSARELYEDVPCDGTGLEKNSAGPLFLSCPISEASMLARSPSDFGASWLEGAFREKSVKLRQVVSMLQCVEQKHTRDEKRGDKTVEIVSWTYSLEWKTTPVDSQGFKAWSVHAAKEALRSGCGPNFQRNPSFPLSSQELATNSLMAGSFDLSRHLSAITADEPVALQHGSYGIPSSLSGGSSRGGQERRVAKDGTPYTYTEFLDYYGNDRGSSEWQVARPAASQGSASGGIVGNSFHTCTGGFEDVGCLRISYFRSSATHLSHLARVSGRAAGLTKTRPWTAPKSWMCSSGSSSQVDLFAASVRTAEELVESAEASNAASTWALRILGMVLAVVGVMMFLNPLQAVANLVDEFFDWFRFIPILGWLLDTLGDAIAGAVGCAIFAVSLGIGLPSSILVLSITWCVMRPLLGIPMFLGSAAAICYSVRGLFQMAKNGKERRQKDIKHA
eukprot:TRINITY_DN10385_c0_g2_i1.p1 TRINITY_DN10385_c0_g2~~TRINITY_DN10385_c0_g2_i1.p1  ORF type:complete len:517 (-),score=89.49 TRINITY_DN10385_c0_g2_i1:58-1608(-)